jgi:putative ABC transport system ATP-binding protein
MADDLEFVAPAVMVYTLEAIGLYRFYHSGDEEVVALRGIDVRLEAGQFVALCGPSGSGKSTLLACLSGLVEPDGGVVMVHGERLTRRGETARARLRARHFGVLMQSGNLFQHLAIGEAVRFQMLLAGRDRPDEIEGLLASLGLSSLIASRPPELSGGEAARAGLAVALATKPTILLCDEPTAEVDEVTERGVVDHLVAYSRQGAAVLVATHSKAVALRADRLIAMRDGRLTNG